MLVMWSVFVSGKTVEEWKGKWKMLWRLLLVGYYVVRERVDSRVHDGGVRWGWGGKSSQVKCNVKETFPFSTLLLLLMLRVVYRRVNPLEITSHSINFMTLLMVFVWCLSPELWIFSESCSPAWNIHTLFPSKSLDSRPREQHSKCEFVMTTIFISSLQFRNASQLFAN